MKDLVEHARRTMNNARDRVAEEAGRLAAAERHYKDAARAQVVLQQSAQVVQQQAHDQIASVVTRCLRTVYRDRYEFKIQFEKKRGRTEARLAFVKSGNEEDPLDGSGGGIVDVASLALRLTCIMLRKPRGRKLLVLDEPFKNINGDGNRERAAQLLSALADDFGVQIIMTTGYDWLKIGTVVEL